MPLLRDPGSRAHGQIERNNSIYEDVKRGMTVHAAAAKYNVAASRIAQIVLREENYRKWRRQFARQQKKLKRT